MQWSEVTLRVHDVAACVDFYRGVLGMRRISAAPHSTLLELPTRSVGEARLRLVAARDPDPIVATRDDAFWKLGFTVENLDRAVARLRQRGVEVSDPAQFEDIGYLCHLRDPSGHALELLQTTFESGDPLPESAEPLGSAAVLAHVTLRVSRLESALESWSALGFHLISTQPVPRFGFTLYFLATAVEQRPREELDAVANREWLWQRPYTCLELQHFPERADDFVLASDAGPGLESLRFASGAGTVEVRLAPGDRYAVEELDSSFEGES